MVRAGVLFSIFTVLCLFVPSAARAQEDTLYGPKVGVYMPVDGELRDLLGDRWFSIGIAAVRKSAGKRATLTVDWNIVSREDGDNRVLILSPSIGYIYAFTGPENDVQPYVAARLGLAYFDYRLARFEDQVVSGRRFGVNGNLEFGVMIGERLRLAARYDVYSRMDGFRFDGLSFELTYGLVKF